MNYYNIANFARTKGAKDKGQRLRRAIGGGLALAGVGAGAYLGAKYLKNRSINKNIKSGVSKSVNNIVSGLGKVADDIKNRC